jgi:hypothetical protein
LLKSYHRAGLFFFFFFALLDPPFAPIEIVGR